jgi:hypothetical protein
VLKLNTLAMSVSLPEINASRALAEERPVPKAEEGGGGSWLKYRPPKRKKKEPLDSTNVKANQRADDGIVQKPQCKKPPAGRCSPGSKAKKANQCVDEESSEESMSGSDESDQEWLKQRKPQAAKKPPGAQPPAREAAAKPAASAAPHALVRVDTRDRTKAPPAAAPPAAAGPTKALRSKGDGVPVGKAGKAAFVAALAASKAATRGRQRQVNHRSPIAYKYVVQPGNNSRLILQAFRRRPWWGPTKTSDAGLAFVWSPYRMRPKHYAVKPPAGCKRMLNHFEGNNSLTSKKGLLLSVSAWCRQVPTATSTYFNPFYCYSFVVFLNPPTHPPTHPPTQLPTHPPSYRTTRTSWT